MTLEAAETRAAHTHTPLTVLWRTRPVSALALALIRLYQATFSRLLPINTCRFVPSCSHYGYEAIEKYGILKGGWLAFLRILRCQPFCPGGFDPVP